ncbi:MAG: hypothetical protein KAJ19_12020 [Gammaproteobacteria bacterium]|nr:hypothetical protein [Gammaproteobacteria bacterium]
MIEYRTDAICLPTRTSAPQFIATETVTKHLNKHAKEGWRLVGQSGGDSVVYVTLEKVTQPSGLAPA